MVMAEAVKRWVITLESCPELTGRAWAAAGTRELREPRQTGGAQSMALAMISRAWAWMAASCSGPRKDSA